MSGLSGVHCPDQRALFVIVGPADGCSQQRGVAWRPVGQHHRRGAGRRKTVRLNGHNGVGRVIRTAMRLVDDGDVEILPFAHGVGGHIDIVRIGNRDRLHVAMAAQIERLDAVALRAGLVVSAGRNAGIRIGDNRVRINPLFVVKINSASAICRPRMHVIERPQRRGEGIAGAVRLRRESHPIQSAGKGNYLPLSQPNHSHKAMGREYR